MMITGLSCSCNRLDGAINKWKQGSGFFTTAYTVRMSKTSAIKVVLTTHHFSDFITYVSRNANCMLLYHLIFWWSQVSLTIFNTYKTYLTNWLSFYPPAKLIYISRYLWHTSSCNHTWPHIHSWGFTSIFPILGANKDARTSGFDWASMWWAARFIYCDCPGWWCGFPVEWPLSDTLFFVRFLFFGDRNCNFCTSKMHQNLKQQHYTLIIYDIMDLTSTTHLLFNG